MLADFPSARPGRLYFNNFIESLAVAASAKHARASSTRHPLHTNPPTASPHPRYKTPVKTTPPTVQPLAVVTGSKPHLTTPVRPKSVEGTTPRGGGEGGGVAPITASGSPEDTAPPPPAPNLKDMYIT